MAEPNEVAGLPLTTTSPGSEDDSPSSLAAKRRQRPPSGFSGFSGFSGPNGSLHTLSSHSAHSQPQSHSHSHSQSNSQSGLGLGYSSEHNRRSNQTQTYSQTMPTSILLTPLSAKGSKKRLSVKLADRFHKFEGASGSAMDLPSSNIPSSIDEMGAECNSDNELSPLRMSSHHQRLDGASLSAIARRRSIGTSLVGRVKVFDSPKKQAVSILLSPQEVKQLVLSTSNNRRIQGIKSHFEQRKELKAKVSAKEAQRKLLLQINKETRRKEWHETKLQFEGTETTRYQFGARMVYTDVKATTMDLKSFVPPDHGPKTPHQRQLILDVVDRNFIFAAFRINGKARTDQSLEALIRAFQVVQLDMGHVLWHATESIDNNSSKSKNSNHNNNSMDSQAQAFHIIEKGSIAFYSDGSIAATATARDCFGEQSLLYPAPSTVTVAVALESEHQGQKGAVLLKLEPNTFRGLVYIYSKQAEEEKRQALMQVDFLQNLVVFPTIQPDSTSATASHHDGQVQDLLRRMASAMTRIEFKRGDTFDAPEDTTFFIIQSGQTIVRNRTETLHMELHPGDYFGERALIGSLPRRSIVCTQTVMTASSDQGVLFRINRSQMERILGPTRLQNLKDLYGLLNVALIKRAQLSHRIRAGFAKAVTEQCHVAQNNAFNVQPHDQPALYVVREGKVEVSSAGKSQHFTTGDIFGHDQLQEATDDQGNSTLCRTDGLQVTALDGEDAAIAILPVHHDRQPEHDQQSNEISSQKTTPTINDSANGSTKQRPSSHTTSLSERRQLIRQHVQEKVTLDDLEKIRLLGEGEFGEVWLVATDILKTKELKHKFALKSQRKEDDNRGTDALYSIQQEIEIMRQIEHRQIVDLIHTYDDEQNVYMLLELIPGGDLWERIYHDQGDGTWKSGMPEDHARFYTMVIADTLGYLHSRQIIFRDLKPENVMIDIDGYPMLVDFGFAKFCPDKTFTFCGTPNYVAPEIIMNSGHNRAVDYWALGITIYEMISGENPFYFDGMDQVTLYNSICQDNYYPLSGGNTDVFSASLHELVEQLLEKDPIRRLGMLAGGMDDILNHAWFEEIDLMLIRKKRWPAPWKPTLTGDEQTECLIDMDTLSNIPLPLLNDSSHSLHASFTIIDDFEPDSSPAQGEGSQSTINNNDDSQSSFVDDCSSDKDSKTKKSTKSKNTRMSAEQQEQQQQKIFSSDLDRGPPRKSKMELRAEKEKSKSRRTTISATLAELGIDSDDEYQLFYR